MNGYRLGIDYGTSNTVAMLRWPDGRVRPLLFDGSPLLPSAVCVDEQGRVATGRDAVRRAKLAPASYEPNVKRRIDDLEMLLGDRSYQVVDLVAATLRRVAAEAETVVGAAPGSVVITCPVAWGPARRSALTSAALAAGLAEPVVLAEPVAAATYFAAGLGADLPAGRCLVVYDLGAGTFDVSVMRRTPTGFETLSYRGLDDFGGLDLDAIVVNHVGAQLAATTPHVWERLSSPADQADRRHFRMLWDDARDAKEMLSRQPSAGVYVMAADRDVILTRDEFDRDAGPRLAHTVDVTVACIREARIPANDVAAVFLVGGGSRVPMIATMLHRKLGVAPTITDQPEIVVAEGALLAAPGAPDASPPAGGSSADSGGRSRVSAAIGVATLPPSAPAVGPLPGYPPAPSPVSVPPSPTSPVSAAPVPQSAPPLAPSPPSAPYAAPWPASAPPADASPTSAPPVAAFAPDPWVAAGSPLSASADPAVPAPPAPASQADSTADVIASRRVRSLGIGAAMIAIAAGLIAGGGVVIDDPYYVDGDTMVAACLLLFLPGAVTLAAAIGTIARTLRRYRLRVDRDAVTVHVPRPVRAGVLQIAGLPLGVLTLIVPGSYLLDTDDTAASLYFVLAGLFVPAAGWLAYRLRRAGARWRRDRAAIGPPTVDTGAPATSTVEYRYPWSEIDAVTIRRSGRLRRRVVVASTAVGDLDVCDLSAADLPTEPTAAALRRHGGTRFQP